MVSALKAKIAHCHYRKELIYSSWAGAFKRESTELLVDATTYSVSSSISLSTQSIIDAEVFLPEETS